MSNDEAYLEALPQNRHEVEAPEVVWASIADDGRSAIGSSSSGFAELNAASG